MGVVTQRSSNHNPLEMLPENKNFSTVSNISCEDVSEAQRDSFHIPPNVLDCCLQTAQFLRRSGSTFVPTGMDACAMPTSMSTAESALEKVLEEVTINDPQVPVFSNVTATQFPDAAGVRPLL